MSKSKSCSKLAGIRRRKKEARKKKTFNKVLGKCLTLGHKIEEAVEESKNPHFPANKSSKLLVDLLVKTSNNVKKINDQIYGRPFLYDNIETIHNFNLKKIFKEDHSLEAILIKKRRQKNVRPSVKKRSKRKLKKRV